MRALGVDLSLANCGVAVVENSHLLFVATVRPDRGLSTSEKRDRILKYVKALWDKYTFGVMVMEKARLFTGGGNVPLFSIEAIISLSTTLEDWAHAMDVPVVKVAPPTWRKLVLGNGRADKKDAVAFVFKIYKRELKQDAAEAVCQALYGLKVRK